MLGAAAAGVRVGARGRRRAAADVRRLEGRLVDRRQAVADGAHPARAAPTSSRSTTTTAAPSSRSGSSGCSASIARSSAPSTWRAATAARSRARCRSRRSTRWRRSTGASSRARRRPTCRGTRGRSRTSIAQPAVWFHEIFKQDGTPYKQDEVDLIRLADGRAGSGRRARLKQPAAFDRSSHRWRLAGRLLIDRLDGRERVRFGGGLVVPIALHARETQREAARDTAGWPGCR